MQNSKIESVGEGRGGDHICRIVSSDSPFSSCNLNCLSLSSLLLFFSTFFQKKKFMSFMV